MLDVAAARSAEPKAERTLNSGGGLGLVRLGRAVLLAVGATDGSSARFARGMEDRTPFTVLVHLADRSTASTRLMSSDATLEAVMQLRGTRHAIAVPDTMLPPHPAHATAVELDDTPLVHASCAMVRTMCSEMLPGRANDPSAAAGLEEVAVAIVRGVIHEQLPALLRPAPADAVQRRVWTLIAQRHRDPTFDVAAIARELSFSRRQLYRRFEGDTGVAALIARHRLASATREIREDPARRLDLIALHSGFASGANMRATFAAHLGMTPTNYRQRALESPR